MTVTSKFTDPVCGMVVDPHSAAAKSDFQGTTYFFCSDECRRMFEANPTRHAGPTRSAPKSDPPLERHEPPFTKAGGIVAPKFGAAGSGGAEYERLPEAHDDNDAH